MSPIKTLTALSTICVLSACGAEEPQPCFTKAGGYYGTATLIKNECPILQPDTMEGYVNWPMIKEIRKCGPAGGIQDRYYDYLMDCDVFHIVDAMAAENKIYGSLIIMWSCAQEGIGYLLMQDPVKHPDFKCDLVKDDDCKSKCEDEYEFSVTYKES